MRNETIPSSQWRHIVSVLVIRFPAGEAPLRLNHLFSTYLRDLLVFRRLAGDLLYRKTTKVNPVLRISMNDDAIAATLKVEGKVVGPWATELGRTWHDLWASARQKRLRLDIRGVTFADQKGTQILREIVRATGAEVIADSPLTQYFANQASGQYGARPQRRVNMHASGERNSTSTCENCKLKENGFLCHLSRGRAKRI